MRKITVLVLVIIAITAASAILFIAYQNVFLHKQANPTPTPAPAPIFNVVLSPSYQELWLPAPILTFNVSIVSENNTKIQFPCTIALVDPDDSTWNIASDTKPTDYGTYLIQTTLQYPQYQGLPQIGQHLRYYAVVQDSTGAKFKSNAVLIWTG